ncbi:hypothetical protein Y032_0019g3848 [Ancylostoma ceylanicum]|uniref:Uncharacterized protein n=1 Tax=Ancylostoma ceylanicum TaxID=53326 RepID=A0A016V3A4_9BILA|nr:hypothetical protein Y032_0019g3848 [Ancylostoma ceylanicum]
MGLLLASLMHAENLELEKAKIVYSACLMAIHGKHLCHQHYKSAASWLLSEARSSLEDPNQLDAHLRVALEPAHPQRTDVVPMEVLQRLQSYVELFDKATPITMLDIVRFLSDCASRYGLNNIVAEMDGSRADTLKRRLDLDSEEMMPECSSKSLRLDEALRSNSVPSGLEALLFAAESLGRIESETKPEGHAMISLPSGSFSQPNTSPSTWKKIFCVEGERLKELFRFCPRCGSRQEERESSVQIRAVGSAPVVTVRCNKCSGSSSGEVVWSGQSKAVDHPKARAFSNNIRIATAAATNGVRISSILRFAKEADLACIPKSTFYHVFERMRPAIHRVYMKHQIDIFQRVKAAYEDDHANRGWNITVDCSYDRRALFAPMCKVQAVDLKTKLHLHTEVLQSSEADRLNGCKEVEGLRRLLHWFADRDIRIHSVSADMNPSFGRVVAEINRELSWDMQWYIDPWQLGRHLAREVQEVSRRRSIRLLRNWVKTLRAHVIYAARMGSETGDVRNTRFIFNTCLYHVAGIHKWEQDEVTGPLTECGHGTLECDRIEPIPFGSVAYERLKKIVLQPHFQKNLCKLSPHGWSNWIGTKNALDHMYSPKEMYLPPESYSIYICMSSLHMNTLTLAETQAERAAPYQYPFQSSNDFLTTMIHKTTAPHLWRREIVNEYLVEMKTVLNWDASAEGEELDAYPGFLDDEELYPDVPPLPCDFEDMSEDVCRGFNSDEEVDLGSEIFALEESPLTADQNGICDSVQNCRKTPFLTTYSG